MVVAFERNILFKATALFVIPDLFGNLLFCKSNDLRNCENSKWLVAEYRSASADIDRLM
jgi:hypothetical protein